MATTELDPPRMSAVTIATRRFSTARHGYEPEEVHEFLEAAAEHVREMEGELRRQQARMGLLERRVAAAREAAYARVFRQLMDVVRAAEHAAEEVREAAEAEARAIVETATQRAASVTATDGDPAVPDETDADEAAASGNEAPGNMSIDVELLWGTNEA